jgi:hypothetical protein
MASRTKKMTPKLCWNRELRTLYFGNKAIKILKNSAQNQVAILDAFQELGWPLRIDDPLPPKPGLNAKRRLCDAIESLHDGLIGVRFHGDGTGTGIRLESPYRRRPKSTGTSPDGHR